MLSLQEIRRAILSNAPAKTSSGDLIRGQMKKKNSKKIVRGHVWDPQKDSVFKELAAIMASSGYTVRREELKQGPGWRVVSGSCRLEEQRLIFVDRKLQQDDQITFLIQRMTSLGIKIEAEKLAALPEKVREMIAAREESIAA